jgi:heme o synthase
MITHQFNPITLGEDNCWRICHPQLLLVPLPRNVSPELARHRLRLRTFHRSFLSRVLKFPTLAQPARQSLLTIGAVRLSCGGAGRSTRQRGCMAAAHGVRIARTTGWKAGMIRDYLQLAKYRLSGLVAFTAGVGYVMRADDEQQGSPQQQISVRFWRELSATTAGTFMAAAAANTLNQMYEIQSDARMGRTRLRPLPTGRLSLAQAAAFAAASAASGIALLVHETNPAAATIAAANIALYAGVYTPLKALSPINTWVGAVVGALPPMLGWAAASGGKLTGERERGGWALGGLLFLWQIPHFHALAAVARADYAAGGLKMLAVTNPSCNAQWAKLTSAAMIPVGAAFVSCDLTSDIFGWEAAVLGAWMYRGAARMSAAPASARAARPLFKASIVHLPVTMLLMMAHKLTPAERARREASNQRRDRAYLDRQQDMNPIRIYHPWETLAPFPFLPLPLTVPAAVVLKKPSAS